MQENSIKVSVIMPVYNSGQYLETAVNSIISQSFKDWELILVDDGSTDGSSEKCDEYASKDSRIVVIHQKNGGICNARNAALYVAKGEYIAFSDHDDEYLPNLLDNVYAYAKKENADIVKFGKKEYVIRNGTVLYEKSFVLPSITYFQKNLSLDLPKLMNRGILECVWDCLFRRELLISNNILFDETFKTGGEDIDFILNILRYVNRISFLNEIYYVHYVREGFSTSGKYNSNIFDSVNYLATKVLSYIKDFGIKTDIPDVEMSYYFMYSYVNTILKYLAHRNCNLSFSEKLDKISTSANNGVLWNHFFAVSSFDMIKRSTKVGLSFYFYKHHFYRTLLIINYIYYKLCR